MSKKLNNKKLTTASGKPYAENVEYQALKEMKLFIASCVISLGQI